MKCTWLGQAGLLFETDNFQFMIDPYFTNSVGRNDPRKTRRIAVDPRFLKIRPDLVIFTHNHLDHYDPETVSGIITSETRITVLSPTSVWQEVRKIGGQNNYVLFNRHTIWTESGIRFIAVKAEHSDPTAIGVIVDDGSKKYYITGDTLCNQSIFADIPNDIYAVFLPVNGEGNNMNFEDAAWFSQKIQAQHTVPIHWGMLDDLNGNEFICENVIVPKMYEEVFPGESN